MDETPETVRHPPGDSGEPQGSQRAPEFTRQCQSGSGFESQHEDEDEDDRESVAEISPPDKAYNNLMYYIYDRFPHSRPTSAPHLPPRCEFEEFFATSAVTSSTKPNLLNPLVPYPHTYIALYSSHAKVTCNTHTHPKTRSC